MVKLKAWVAICVLAMTVGSANANTFQVFDLSTSGTDAVAGTITVDETTDTISAFSIPSIHPFTVLSNQGQSGSEYFLNVKTAVYEQSCSNPPTCSILIPVSNDLEIAFNDGGLLSLFSGGALDPDNTFIEIGLPFAHYDLTGTLEPASATPLPAALPLFATGLGAMGLFGWRRKRKNTAAIVGA